MQLTLTTAGVSKKQNKQIKPNKMKNTQASSKTVALDKATNILDDLMPLTSTPSCMASETADGKSIVRKRKSDQEDKNSSKTDNKKHVFNQKHLDNSISNVSTISEKTSDPNFLKDNSKRRKQNDNLPKIINMDFKNLLGLLGRLNCLTKALNEQFSIEFTNKIMSIIKSKSYSISDHSNIIMPLFYEFIAIVELNRMLINGKMSKFNGKIICTFFTNCNNTLKEDFKEVFIQSFTDGLIDYYLLSIPFLKAVKCRLQECNNDFTQLNLGGLSCKFVDESDCSMIEEISETMEVELKDSFFLMLKTFHELSILITEKDNHVELIEDKKFLKSPSNIEKSVKSPSNIEKSVLYKITLDTDTLLSTVNTENFQNLLAFQNNYNIALSIVRLKSEKYSKEKFSEAILNRKQDENSVWCRKFLTSIAEKWDATYLEKIKSNVPPSKSFTNETIDNVPMSIPDLQQVQVEENAHQVGSQEGILCDAKWHDDHFMSFLQNHPDLELRSQITKASQEGESIAQDMVLEDLKTNLEARFSLTHYFMYYSLFVISLHHHANVKNENKTPFFSVDYISILKSLQKELFNKIKMNTVNEIIELNPALALDMAEKNITSDYELKYKQYNQKVSVTLNKIFNHVGALLTQVFDYIYTVCENKKDNIESLIDLSAYDFRKIKAFCTEFALDKKREISKQLPLTKIFDLEFFERDAMLIQSFKNNDQTNSEVRTNIKNLMKNYEYFKTMLSSPVNQKNTSSDDDIANSLCSSLTEQEKHLYKVYADNELSWDRTTSTINESVVKKYGVKASLIIFNKINAIENNPVTLYNLKYFAPRQWFCDENINGLIALIYNDFQKSGQSDNTIETLCLNSFFLSKFLESKFLTDDSIDKLKRWLTRAMEKSIHEAKKEDFMGIKKIATVYNKLNEHWNFVGINFDKKQIIVGESLGESIGHAMRLNLINLVTEILKFSEIEYSPDWKLVCWSFIQQTNCCECGPCSLLYLIIFLYDIEMTPNLTKSLNDDLNSSEIRKKLLCSLVNSSMFYRQTYSQSITSEAMSSMVIEQDRQIKEEILGRHPHFHVESTEGSNSKSQVSQSSSPNITDDLKNLNLFTVFDNLIGLLSEIQPVPLSDNISCYLPPFSFSKLLELMVDHYINIEGLDKNYEKLHLLISSEIYDFMMGFFQLIHAVLSSNDITVTQEELSSLEELFPLKVCLFITHEYDVASRRGYSFYQTLKLLKIRDLPKDVSYDTLSDQSLKRMNEALQLKFVAASETVDAGKDLTNSLIGSNDEFIAHVKEQKQSDTVSILKYESTLQKNVLLSHNQGSIFNVDYNICETIVKAISNDTIIFLGDSGHCSLIRIEQENISTSNSLHDEINLTIMNAIQNPSDNTTLFLKDIPAAYILIGEELSNSLNGMKSQTLESVQLFVHSKLKEKLTSSDSNDIVKMFQDFLKIK